MSKFQRNGARRWGMPILGAALAMASWGMVAAPSRADDAPAGSITTHTMPAASAGLPVDYNVYLPAGYEAGVERYATLYLFHGRGDTSAAWPRVKSSLDELIGALRSVATRMLAEDAAVFKGAPYLAPRRRLDETAAARKPVLAWRDGAESELGR